MAFLFSRHLEAQWDEKGDNLREREDFLNNTDKMNKNPQVSLGNFALESPW